MAKLTKPITGVPDGEIYPRILPAGADCPPALLDHALSMGALDAADDGNLTVSIHIDPRETKAYQEALAELEKTAADLDARSEQLDAREAAVADAVANLDQRQADLAGREEELAARMAAADLAAQPAQSDQPEPAKGKGRTGKADPDEQSA